MTDYTTLCPYCYVKYDGYHKCDKSSDRVEYVCIDCKNHVERDTHQLELTGIPPKRCTSCTFDQMGS